MRKERAVATIRVAVRGSERVGVNRYRGLDGVLSECARGPAAPLLLKTQVGGRTQKRDGSAFAYARPYGFTASL